MSDRKFVKIPGVIEIRWISDDPDTYVKPTDLYEEQDLGLIDFLGKKDKGTTEQAYFYCFLCESELKSIKTLRDHCNGRNHLRRALQREFDYRRRTGRNLKEEAGGRKIEDSPSVSMKRKDRSRSPGRSKEGKRDVGAESGEYQRLGADRSKDEDQNFVNIISRDNDVKRLHDRVTFSVKTAMNRYYPGSKDFDRKLQRKICSEQMYSQLARELSLVLREKITESFKAYKMVDSLEGLEFTRDNEEYIKAEVDSYLESNIPLTQ